MTIPGHGVDKVNASHAFGGPRLEADTIGATVGVKIPYVIDTDFDGFIGMVDDLGGITVNVPTRMQDSFSGADFQPGPQNKFDTFDILPKWDYLALAKAFGAEGIRVATVGELNSALTRIRKIKDRPVLVEVVIPQKDLPGQMYRLGSE